MKKTNHILCRPRMALDNCVKKGRNFKKGAGTVPRRQAHLGWSQNWGPTTAWVRGMRG